VTLWQGREGAADEAVRRRFLARHPEAAFYADFPTSPSGGFAVEGAHYIGGFDASSISRRRSLVDQAAGDLLAAEPDILAI
jgi:hypothetical protein